MTITKELKNVSFEYVEADKSFVIKNTKDGGEVKLSKVESFAFMRFLVRISQRNWLRKKPAQPKANLKEDWSTLSINPDQLEILITENE